MNNYNLQWRIWAKVVAFFDLIVSILSLMLTLLIIFFAGAATQAVANSDTKAPEGVEVIAWFIWLIVVIMAIMTAVSLWAAVQLIKATELGREAKDAYKFCQYWQIVCIVFIVLNFMSNIVMASYYMMVVIQLLIRGIFLYVVHRFMQELEAVVIGIPRQMKQSQNV